MRKLLIILFCILCTTFAFSQESVDTTDVQFYEIEKAYEAILQLREASESGDSSKIEQAYKKLHKLHDVDFDDLRNRHLIDFPEDSNTHCSPYRVDDRFPHRHSSWRDFPRQRSLDADVSCTIMKMEAKSERIITYTCRGKQELAVVAGAGGKVTIEVHVTNSKAGIDFQADDTDDVRRGRPSRKRAFKLPGATTSTIRVKIINCGDKACNVVLIKNN
ncbi:MAG: hypothetical protein IKP93_05440 [Paludibacteraceae bacterium]|nr:hypothetical protein [Paludibacteraceae bacterium]